MENENQQQGWPGGVNPPHPPEFYLARVGVTKALGAIRLLIVRYYGEEFDALGKPMYDALTGAALSDLEELQVALAKHAAAAAAPEVSK